MINCGQISIFQQWAHLRISQNGWVFMGTATTWWSSKKAGTGELPNKGSGLYGRT